MSKRGETLGEAQERVAKTLRDMSKDSPVLIARLWARWQLLRLRRSIRRQDKAQEQFINTLIKGRRR